MISRHLQQYVDNNCVGGAQMDVLLEDGVDGAKRAVIRLSEMDDDKEDVNIRLKRHDDNTADCVFGSRGMADERQVFHDAAEKVVEWMMGAKVASVGSECARDSSRRALPCRACRSSPKEGGECARVGRSALNRKGSPRDFQAGRDGRYAPAAARGRGKGVDGGEDDVFDMTLGNLEGGGPIFGRQEDVVQEKPAQWREAPRKPVVRVGQISRERGLSLSVSLCQRAGGSDGDTAKMTRFKEQADAYQLKKLAKWVVAEVRTEEAPPEVRNQMMTLHQVAELIVKNACAPDGATQPEEIPSAKALIKWMQENLFEGKGKERKLRAGREGDPRGHHVLNQPRPAPRRENMKIDSTWTAAVDEHQKGLSEALATYKGKALKGKGKGKEVEVADAPVSLLEKWEKSPVSQDDDDILDVNDEIAKGKRLRQQLAVQPRDLDEMSKALVHRNRVWTRNLFVGPQKLLARDLHLSRAEQNATIFANSESDYGHDKLVIPVWRYSFQFLADRSPTLFMTG
eukprot:jgi/Mesvir1/4310/Mv14043-RA.1